jgi:tetratricopeptide (TPR) repeat protein
MDRSSRSGFARQVWQTLALALLLVSVGHAQDPGVRKEILQLNQVTGAKTILLKVKALQANPQESKKLLADAWEAAKEGKKKGSSLNYNGAIILAQVAQEAKNLSACETFYRIAMAEAARLQSPNKLLESYGGLIDALYENKKYSESSKVCKELLDLKTDDGKERTVLIAVTGRGGETEFIEDDGFDSAKRLRPGVQRLYIQSLAKQGKYDQAAKMADDLIRQNDHWLIRQLKGWVLHEAGKFEEAAKVYEDVIDRVAKDDDLAAKERDSYLERYRYALSGIFLDMGKIDRSSELLQKLLEMKPNSPSYNNDLGFIWADNDMKLPEAEKLIRKALELERKQRKDTPGLDRADDHDNGAYLDSLGWVLFKQKKYEEAKEVLLKAVADKSSQHLEIYDHLGDTLFALGEKEAALTAWRKGIEAANDTRRDRERKALVEKKLAKNK